MSSRVGFKHTQETKDKISLSKKGTSFGHKFERGHTHSKETIEKLRIGSTNNNPRYWLGKKRSKETIEKAKQTRINNEPHFITIESRKKMGDKTRGKTYEKIHGIEMAARLRKNLSKVKTGLKHSLETKNKIRRNTIKQIQDGKLPQLYNTDIEILMRNKLNELKINFIQQYNFNNMFICDFYIPSMNTIIECDGIYWHSSGKKRRTDSYKNINLKESYRLLRFSDVMIKKRIEDCVNILYNKNITFFTWADSYGFEIKLVGEDEKEIIKKLKDMNKELVKTYIELNLEEVK